MLRFSSCCSHVLSLLSSGSVCRSLQFTKTWPTGQGVAAGEEDGCWQELGCPAGCLEHLVPGVGSWVAGVVREGGGPNNWRVRERGAVMLSGAFLGFPWAAGVP